jgi:hypothetical protein
MVRDLLRRLLQPHRPLREEVRGHDLTVEHRRRPLGQPVGDDLPQTHVPRIGIKPHPIERLGIERCHRGIPFTVPAPGGAPHSARVGNRTQSPSGMRERPDQPDLRAQSYSRSPVFCTARASSPRSLRPD